MFAAILAARRKLGGLRRGMEPRGRGHGCAPYRSWWGVQALDDNPLLATGAREPTFEVGPGGLARLELDGGGRLETSVPLQNSHGDVVGAIAVE